MNNSSASAIRLHANFQCNSTLCLSTSVLFKKDIIISMDIPQMHGMLALITLESIIKGSEYFASSIEAATIQF